MDAYIQVIKDDYKVNFVLENFRKTYPNSNITLVSDDGEDLTELSNRFNCHYLHSTFKTGNDPKGFNKDQTIEWLNRFYNAFEKSTSKYLIYLEDDVLVRNRIDINFDSNILGLKVNLINQSIIDYFEKKYKTTFTSKMYGACGGTIYKVEFFLNNFNNFIKIIEDSFDEVQKLHQIQFGYLDMFMPVLYMLCNSTYDDNVFLCETHRNSNCMNSNSKIIHGKQIYN